MASGLLLYIGGKAGPWPSCPWAGGLVLRQWSSSPLPQCQVVWEEIMTSSLLLLSWVMASTFLLCIKGQGLPLALLSLGRVLASSLLGKGLGLGHSPSSMAMVIFLHVL